jgi:hypothetical protein
MTHQKYSKYHVAPIIGPNSPLMGPTWTFFFSSVSFFFFLSFSVGCHHPWSSSLKIIGMFFLKKINYYHILLRFQQNMHMIFHFGGTNSYYKRPSGEDFFVCLSLTIF